MDSKIMAYSPKLKKKVEMVEVKERRPLKNGTVMVLGMDTNGNKLSTIVSSKK